MSLFTSSVELVEPAPLPKHIPDVGEVGVTSGPSKSASFFLQAFCKDYNDDFMACRRTSGGDPAACLAEGRRVTRCTQTFFEQLEMKCLDSWKEHYNCMENYNQKLFPCRPQEKVFNKCVFDEMKLKKEIPDALPDRAPIHERTNVYFKPRKGHYLDL